LIVGTGDFNGDGTSDILWRNNSTGEVAVWLMNNAQVSTSAGFGIVPAAYSIVGTGDLNGDGKSDVLWRDNAGNVSMWLMNGTTATYVPVGIVPTAWTIQSLNAE
jgi:hypothetical protein